MPTLTNRELEELKAKAWTEIEGSASTHCAVSKHQLRKLLSSYEERGRALDEIARGEVPPDQHGHYLAHREAVRRAREAMS